MAATAWDSSPAMDLLVNATSSVFQKNQAMRDAGTRIFDQIKQLSPGMPAYKHTWLQAATPLTGIQAFQVVESRGLLQSREQVCIHLMGDFSDGYLNLYQHLFTISAGLKFIRLVLVSPELERDDTDEVEVQGDWLSHVLCWWSVAAESPRTCRWKEILG